MIEQLESRLLFSVLNITHGGTYDGGSYSAVTVDTAEPVIIQNARITGTGDLIKSNNGASDITIRNCIGTSLNPGVAGQAKGRFFNDDVGFKRAFVWHNTLIDTAGIELDANGQAGTEIEVSYNEAFNIDGRLSTGAGFSSTGYDIVQFVQISNAPATSARIRFNYVANEKGKSRVEDNISVYQSGGTASNRIIISDNRIDGAYDGDPFGAGDVFAGGGIICDLGASFVTVKNNEVINTTNYAVAIAGGGGGGDGFEPDRR